MKQYLDLVQHVLDNGRRKENRTGVDTISTFNYNYEIDLADGFPMLTTKSISWKNIVVELLWFISGNLNIALLKHHGCRFWDSWTDDKMNSMAPYPKMWREFPVHQDMSLGSLIYDMTGGVDHGYADQRTLGPAFNDQMRWVLEEIKANPNSRRLVVSAWAPEVAQHSKLPPCHCMFIFNVQGNRLNLHLTQRSADLILGVPYNIASYSLLVSLFAQFTGLKPGIFAHSIVDAHIYTAKEDGSQSEYDHIPGLQTQLKRAPRRLPRLKLDPSLRDLKDLEALADLTLTTENVMSHFVLEGYDPHPAIQFKVAV